MRISTLLATALLLPLTATAEIYKWIDSDGATHYSQIPPKEQNSEALKLRRSTHLTDDESAAILKEQEAILKPEPTDPEAKKREQEQATIRKENCKRAKENLSNLEASAGRRTRDQEGNVSYMPEKERQQKMDAARENIKKYCD